ncbi:CBS domain-containing protein [Noviherbaspirillum agri]
MAISELCNPDVVRCDVKASIAEVAGLMREHHVGDVIVADMNADARVPVGIVTDRDIVVEAVAKNVDLNMLTAGDIMNEPVATVKEDAGLHETLELMGSLKVRRLPVVRHDGSLVGIVTADDIFDLLSRELSLLSRSVSGQIDVERQLRR